METVFMLLLAFLGGVAADGVHVDGCYGVFCVPPIEADCQAPSVCANLYFYNSSMAEVAVVQGTGDYKTGLNKTSIKDVAAVQQVGTGCYRIYTGKTFNGAFYTLEGNFIIDLLTVGFTATTIK